ncbi:MAG: cobaltochelatase subunit CobN, partial [Actinomycetota bacterium]
MIALLSTADTDLLAAQASGEGWFLANPSRLDPLELPELLGDAKIVVLRLLGGKATWPQGLSAVLDLGLPTLVLGGEAVADPELMAFSTVPAGIATQALAYLIAGGAENFSSLAAFLRDTILLSGETFPAPKHFPEFGTYAPERHTISGERPVVAVVFYRAHAVSGNTEFVDTLCEGIREKGGDPLPIFTSSLRGADAGVFELLAAADAVIVTVLASGGTHATNISAGGDDESWDVGALATLDLPIMQALCLTIDRKSWLASSAALSPMDAAMQVAIPEFDGRIITVPCSFKELHDGIASYVGDPERCARIAGIAVRYANLSRIPNAEKRIAIILSSYPTKHARIGNAVGLDTPASAVELLRSLRAVGYHVGDFPEDGDTLIHTLIAAGGHDVEWLTEAQLSRAKARVSLPEYQEWVDALPKSLSERIVKHWGEAPGSLYIDGEGKAAEIVLASLQFGNVIVMIQPPRGFGENPIAIYHDPDLPPSHHYLAAYRWMDQTFGADAMIHLGKHGTLEWLPGKGLGLSAECAPDAVLGDLPLIYPFIVNDPGEGTQAKRRSHAIIIDHLIPPMARAETYGDLAKLEQLLDEYATVVALDPEKVPTVRAQIWEVIQTAQLHHDMHTPEMPGDSEFDEFVLHLDGYLCEIKDVQIRDGLHILGQAPIGEARINLVLAILRATQMWGGQKDALPGLRGAIADHFGLDEVDLLARPGAFVEIPSTLKELVAGPANSAADAVDLIEGLARNLVVAMESHLWDLQAVSRVVADILGGDVFEISQVLEFAATQVVPRLDRTTDEFGNLLHALNGGYVPAGPSGSPTRGLVNVLPTGRNFYSVDPKAIPSKNAWDVGVALADSLLARHLADTGEYPRSVGLTVWGTSAMRTQGDDIGEILALLGCRPVWDDASRRVTGFEIVSLDELGRPRIDVTVRISGFFRDAFPHVIALIDEAVRAVAALDEPVTMNFVRDHVVQDLAAHNDIRRATSRIFGSKPGAYGAGMLPLMDAGNWRSDADLAEVYAVWGGYAYGEGLDGRAARSDMEASFRRMSVAVKNQDTREHDIVDSDDYFQYHGGMVAAVRALTGIAPLAYVGDSAVPDQVRTRTLAEETKRVFRARVVNPRWMAAMQRHGYKGAFEMAATVDYIFGYDATAGVIDDWMYQQLA